MYQSLTVFKTAHDMARHAGARQAVTAQNIANADTPGYAARAMASFADSYSSTTTFGMAATRPGHLQPQAAAARASAYTDQIEPSPNGNSVSLETEAMRAVEISREHNRALAIYRHGMTVLRATLGR